MRRRPLLGSCTAVLLALVLTACGQQDDPSAEEVHDDLVEELLAHSDELSDDQADCIAEAIVDEVGVDEVNDIDFSDDTPAAELEERFGAAAVTARDDCLGDGSTSTSTSSSTTAPATDPTDDEG